MATPFVQNVPVNCTSQTYHHTSNECSKLEENHEDYYKCQFSYLNWCPVCDVHRGAKCGRRRSKSEGVEADPLREHNRLYNSNYDVEHWKRKMVKEYDLCNCVGKPDSCNTEKNTSGQNSYLSVETSLQPMEVDMNADHKLSINKNSSLRKYRDRLLPVNHFYSRNVDYSRNSFAHNNLQVEVCENKQFSVGSCNKCIESSPEKGQVANSVQRKSLKNPNARKNGVLHSSLWSDPVSQNSYNQSSPIQVPSRDSHYHNSQSRHVAKSCIENSSEEFYAMMPFQEAAADVQDRYLRDVEVIRTKLCELRGGTDGKRIRQRSESEPGVGCNGSPLGSSWEPKRARDISPKLLPDFDEVSVPSNNLRLPDSQILGSISTPRSTNSSSRRICQNQYISKKPIPSKISEESFHRCTKHKNEIECEEGDSKEDLEEFCEEDEHSALSNFAVSKNSNSPSAIGECLNSITLNDSVKYEKLNNVSKVGILQLGTGHTDAIRLSLFSHVPPYIRFSMHDVKGESLPFEISRHMKWKLSTITPLVVRRTLLNSGFKLVRSEFSRESNDWCGTWGKHMKSLCFKTLKDFQKINHFPGTFQIGRKDRLWKNLYRLMTKFGKKEFGFIPRTYVLPQDSKLLRQAWEKSCGKEKWIIKPPASARGTGIKVIHRWAQIPKKRPLVVQKYISQPYLINGSKFDLRLYVLVTSINPLRVYIYDDGLVRFASVKYSGDMASLGDRYMHLTNYSINKLSSQYTQNEDASACQGHKWTVKTLWSYLEKDGVDVKTLWDNLVDLVIKTIISGESSINQLTKANLVSRYCSYELFGIDVLLDEALKPWLLEVNISPSLHSSSPLDLAVKGPMVRDLMNMAGYQIPNKLVPSQHEELLNSLGLREKVSTLCFDKRLYTTVLSREEKAKHTLHQQVNSRQEYLEEILKDLTPDDVRHLIQSEDELTQVGRFIRIFPTPETYIYHEFFESPRYYNMMFDAWENKYCTNRKEGIKLLENFCQQKIHLSIPVPSAGAKSCASQPNLPVNSISSSLSSLTSQGLAEDISESAHSLERKMFSLASVALYRAARPRSGKLGVVLKPFPRAAYSTRRTKHAASSCKSQSSNSSINGQPEDLNQGNTSELSEGKKATENSVPSVSQLAC